MAQRAGRVKVQGAGRRLRRRRSTASRSLLQRMFMESTNEPQHPRPTPVLRGLDGDEESHHNWDSEIQFMNCAKATLKENFLPFLQVFMEYRRSAHGFEDIFAVTRRVEEFLQDHPLLLARFLHEYAYPSMAATRARRLD